MAGALTAFGAVVGVAVPVWLRLPLLALGLVVLTLVELAGRAALLPQNRRLVPQTVLAAPGMAGPLQFGFEMGTGMRTYSTTALPLASVAMAVLWAPNALEGLALAAGFAAGRTLMVPARNQAAESWDRTMSASGRIFAVILSAAFMAIACGLLRA